MRGGGEPSHLSHAPLQPLQAALRTSQNPARWRAGARSSRQDVAPGYSRRRWRVMSGRRPDLMQEDMLPRRIWSSSRSRDKRSGGWAQRRSRPAVRQVDLVLAGRASPRRDLVVPGRGGEVGGVRRRQRSCSGVTDGRSRSGTRSAMACVQARERFRGAGRRRTAGGSRRTWGRGQSESTPGWPAGLAPAVGHSCGCSACRLSGSPGSPSLAAWRTPATSAGRSARPAASSRSSATAAASSA